MCHKNTYFLLLPVLMKSSVVNGGNLLILQSPDSANSPTIFDFNGIQSESLFVIFRTLKFIFGSFCNYLQHIDLTWDKWATFVAF